MSKEIKRVPICQKPTQLDGHALCWNWDFCRERYEREWGTTNTDTPQCFRNGELRKHMKESYIKFAGCCLALVELGLDE